MKILGIDPGIERTGFAILEMGAGGKIIVHDVGRIFTDKSLPFAQRLNAIATDLRAIVRQWKPSCAGIEQVFFSRNVKTAMKVSHARGVIIEVLEELGVAIQELNPSHIKLSVTGDAKADKQQIRKMLQYLLAINLKSDDAADAIACGICLLSTQRYAQT